MGSIIASTYEIIGKIGSGGGGVVYLANHLRLGKRVVLKADKRKLSTRPEILRREVDTLKNLSHTYIPQVYDFFIEDETVYTVMDFVDGESLDKPLKRGERFEQPQVIKWACQMLEALSYLHSPMHGDPPHGIVHSDIKPANIMLTPHGDICLIDFNIALAIGEENLVGRSSGYASPEHYGLDLSEETPIMDNETEVINPDTEVMMPEMETVPLHQSEYSSSSKKMVIPDARSDIYSLGACLYHLLSGVKPPKSALDVVPLSENEFSPQLVHIIKKAMSPNPNLRYQSAEEMLYAMTHLKETDPRMRAYRRARTFTSAAIALMIIAGVFVSFTGLKRMEETQKALVLAEYAQNAIDEGNPDLARQYALQSFPQDRGLFAPERTAQAQKALADASGVYDLSDGFKAYHLIELPSETLKTVLSEDGKTGAAVYAFAVAIFDTDSGQITATLPTVKSALADVVFLDNDTIIYAGENGICAYNIKENQELWRGKLATSIAVSADRTTVAAVYRDENFATIYSKDGAEKVTISFEDKKQYVLENDTFADPNDNLFELSGDGKYLAVSFADGGLTIFDAADSENSIEIYDESDYTHFEGGFYDRYFAFSSSKSASSVFAVVDIAEYVQTGGFELDSRIGVVADESGIYISNRSTVVKIHPVTGEQQEVAYTDSDIRTFSTDTENTVAATENNDYVFFDKYANQLVKYNAGRNDCNFVDVAGDWAVAAGRDTSIIRILKRKIYDGAELCVYDQSYVHDEARINEDETIALLFNYRGFRLCDMSGKILIDVEIPDPDKVYDQQYSRKSGNLAVMYNDALRIYSGTDGSLLYEKTVLKSVSYSPCGISIFEQDGTIRLIDQDTCAEIAVEKAEGSFGAYYGMVIDDALLNGGKLIGATRIENGAYLFAITGDTGSAVYDSMGTKLFEVPDADQMEAFFTSSAVIFSPLHGTPTVYSLKTGEKLAELETDAYLAYITETDSYVMSEYVSASGERYGILLDKYTFEALAHLPSLTDIRGNELVFDYHKGKLRKTRIYSADELIAVVKGGVDITR